MKTESHKEHQWLLKWVGEWTMEAESFMGPDQPLFKSTGTETVRAVGDLWIQGSGQGEMPGGGTGYMVVTLGYDPQRERFVGTWIGSMMAYLWIYEGTLDESGRKLILDTTGPDMSGKGGTSKYREEIEVADSDHRIWKSYAPAPDGGWQNFMTAHYRRKA